MGEKLYEYLKRQTDEITHEYTSIWQRKRSLKRETKSLLTASQSNAKRTNYVKAKINKKEITNLGYVTIEKKTLIT